MALNITINKVAVAASFAAGATVATAVATGGAAPYVYSLSTGSDKFAINSSTGVVTVIAAMDIDNIASFSVTATDSTSGTAQTGTSDVVYPNIQAKAQSKFNKPNVIYKITKDIDLGNGVLTIPVGCALDFQGGSISNGNVIGSNTVIKAISKIFNNVLLNGSWNNSNINATWFGTNIKLLDNSYYINYAIQSIPIGTTLYIPVGNYTIKNSIILNRNINLNCEAILLSEVPNAPAIIIENTDYIEIYIKELRNTASIFNYKEDYNIDYNIGLLLHNSCFNNIVVNRILSYNTALFVKASNEKGTHYNNILPKVIQSCFTGIKITSITNGWVNGNNFKDCIFLYNTYGNKEYNPSFIVSNSFEVDGISAYNNNSNNFEGLVAEYGINIDNLELVRASYTDGYLIEFRRIEISSDNTKWFNIDYNTCFYNNIKILFMHESSPIVNPFFDAHFNQLIKYPTNSSVMRPDLKQITPNLAFGCTVKFGDIWHDIRNCVVYINLCIINNNPIPADTAIIRGLPVASEFRFNIWRGEGYDYWSTPKEEYNIPGFFSNGVIKSHIDIPTLSHFSINFVYSYNSNPSPR